MARAGEKRVSGCEKCANSPLSTTLLLSKNEASRTWSRWSVCSARRTASPCDSATRANANRRSRASTSCIQSVAPVAIASPSAPTTSVSSCWLQSPAPSRPRSRRSTRNVPRTASRAASPAAAHGAWRAPATVVAQESASMSRATTITTLPSCGSSTGASADTKVPNSSVYGP